MKDTPILREYITNAVLKYSKQIGLTKIPTVIYTQKDVNEIPKKYSRENMRPFKSCLGVYYPNNKLFINIRDMPSKERLKNIIVHELLHARFKDMEHTQIFFEMVGMVLMGKHYPKSIRKLIP